MCSVFLRSIRLFSSARPAGYVGFGSFHSDNVEELIRIPVAAYTRPPLPPSVHAALPPALTPLTPLGTDEIRRMFQIDFGNWTFVNHGAFGASLLPATKYAAAWRDFQETQPLRFFDRTLLPEVVNVYRTMAKFINAPATNIAILQNVTTALNTIVRAESDRWGPGDEVVMLNIGYGAVKSLLRTLCQARGAVVREISLKFPLTSSQILETTLNGISDHTKFVLIDHVTSNTAIQIPIEDIARACSSRNIVVAVDGAHSLLNLHLDCSRLEASGISYFVTNTHKWLCSPKGAAVLWATDAICQRLQPLVLSHGSHHGFTSAFTWDGCHDYSSILSLPVCVDVWQMLGVARVREYCHDLCAHAAAMLANSWGTTVLAKDLHTSMALVQLPLNCGAPGVGDSTAAKSVQDFLFMHGVECPVKAIQGSLYVRISAHVYNRLSDFNAVRDVVLKFKC